MLIYCELIELYEKCIILGVILDSKMILERMFVCMLEIWVFYDVIDKFKLINVDLIEYICFKVIVIFKIGMKIVNIKWIIFLGGENW